MTDRPLPKSPTYTIHARCSELQECLYSELSYDLPVCSCLDPWTNIVHLILDNVSITHPILESMESLLRLPFAKDPSGNSDEEYRWIWVTFKDSFFADRDHLPDFAEDKDDYLSLGAVAEFLETLASRALRVSINNCFSIVSKVLSNGHYWDASGCLRVVEGVHDLLAGFADSVNLLELSLSEEWQQRHKLADQLVRDCDKGIDGPITRLLRNPQNQLMKLSLSEMGLQDYHLSAIVQMMATPTCQIEEFVFSNNFIQVQGMVEFANLLPRMPCLKYVDFRSNVWVKSPCTDEERSTVGAALLEGLIGNTWMETMHGIDTTPQAPLLCFYLAMNRAGRRILTSSEPIPDGLFPLVLARAWKAMSFASGDVVACAMDDRYTKLDGANAIYYFLRNCPKLLSVRL